MGLAKERILRGLFAAAALWAGRLGFEVYAEVQQRRLQHPSDEPPSADLWHGGTCFAVMLVAQLLFRPLFAAVARAMIPKKARWSQAVWGAKVTRCCDAVFKCTYYSAMTAWGFLLLRGEPWVPWVLGGHGETRFCWTDGYPLQPVSTSLRRYYLMAVGYHLSEVAMLLLDARHPDFWEMLLHHTIACSLTVFSYALNYIRVGSLVLLLHGATDIWIYASKTLVDTPNVHLLVTSYFALILSYGWFRIYVFPMYIMRSAWIESAREAGQEKLWGWGFLNFALWVLLVLHMYWFGLIIKIGFLFRKTGQARDIQANLSAVDMLEKKKD